MPSIGGHNAFALSGSLIQAPSPESRRIGTGEWRARTKKRERRMRMKYTNEKREWGTDEEGDCRSLPDILSRC